MGLIYPPPSGTVIMTLIEDQDVLLDVNAYWLMQTTGVMGTLPAALTSGAASFTITPGGLAIPAAPFVCVIDSEPFAVTAVSGSTFTVTRGAAVSFINAAGVAHAAGATVALLAFPSAYAMLLQNLRTFFVLISSTLAKNNMSVVFSASVTGSLAWN